LPANRAGLPMQQVSDWLEKLGLVQYAQRFAENDITFAILPDLTDEDRADQCHRKSRADVRTRPPPMSDMLRWYSLRRFPNTK
jgi:hypothetical protein